MKFDVFISHSNKDKTIADAICHILEENNIRCWIAPRDICPGKTWASEIGQGIKNAQIVLLIYTKNANSSEAVNNEIDIAFSNKKIIMPFLIDNTPMNEGFIFYLNRTHWLVAYPDYKKKFVELINSIRHILDKEEKPIVIAKKTIPILSMLLIAFVIVFVISAALIYLKPDIFKPDISISIVDPLIPDAEAAIIDSNITQTTDTIQNIVISNTPDSSKTPKGQKTEGKTGNGQTPPPNGIVLPSQPVIDDTPQKKEITINKHRYVGFVNNEDQPNGRGTMYFSNHGTIKIGYIINDFETGYRLEGEWNNGECIYGVLYDNNKNERYNNSRQKE